jgi:hypothetical protein
MYRTRKFVVENIKNEKRPKDNMLKYKELRVLVLKFWVRGAITNNKVVIKRRDRLNRSVCSVM